MDDQPKTMSRGLRSLALLAFGLLVGILGADSFARAIGMADLGQVTGDDRIPAIFLRVVLGVVLAFVAVVFAAVAVHFAALLIDRMEHSARRPGLAISIVLISSGATCILLSLIFYWWLAAASTIVRPHGGGELRAISIEAPTGRAGPIAFSASSGVEVSKGTSLATHVVGLGTFFLGAFMLGIGIWGTTAGRPVRRDTTAPPDYSAAASE